MNSRAKGVRGELAVAHLFKAYGFPAERGCQHDGMSGHADVEGVPYIYIEVKRDEDLNVKKAIEQAERDNNARFERTEEELLPVVIHKKNRQPWNVTMRLLDLLYLSGSMPFTATIPVDGLVTMEFDEWIKVFLAYKAEREES